MTNHREAYLLAGIWLLLAIGCRTTSLPPTREEADVEIHTVNGPGRWRAADGWRAVQHLRIGRQHGRPEYTFARIVALEVDDAGHIYVLVAGSYSVKVYDQEGRFLRVHGRQGGGPGEFLNEWGIVGLALLDSDRVGVYDFLMKKVAVFSSDGGVSSIPLTIGRRPLGPAPTSLAALPGTEYLLVHMIQGFSVPRQQEGENTHLLLRVRLGQPDIDTLFAFPGLEATPYVDGLRAHVFPRPFGRSWRWAAGPAGRIAIGSNRSYEVTITDAAGTPTSILSRTDKERPVTEAESREMAATYPWGAGMEGFEPRVRRAAEAALAAVQWPETWPAFDRLVFDSAGRLWVRVPGLPETRSREWHVYDETLSYLGTVTIAEDIEVLRITHRFIYGRMIDDLDVHTVVVLRIERPDQQ